jgi:branched-chain amino acid aminotransferase
MASEEILVHTGEAILPAEEARVPVLDHGFLFGDSVYDVVRTGNRRPFLLQAHIDRLRRSAAMIYFDLPWSDDEVRRRIDELIARLEGSELYFRIVASRGPGPISLLPDGCDRPALYIIGREIIRYPERLYTEGCRVAVVPRLRNDPRALDPRAKTGNYMNNMLGLIEARRVGADDALFLNVDNLLTEATTSNLWIVEGDRVVTPTLAEGLLAGTTRQWVFEVLPAEGIPAHEDTIDPARLEQADEIFLTGTVKGVMPVRQVDDREVRDGRPGPITRKAMQLYRAALARN